MPKEVGYGKGKSQFYPGEGVDPKNEYAHQYHDGNPARGTYPVPKQGGKSSMDYSHPTFGDRSKKAPAPDSLRRN